MISIWKFAWHVPVKIIKREGKCLSSNMFYFLTFCCHNFSLYQSFYWLPHLLLLIFLMQEKQAMCNLSKIEVGLLILCKACAVQDCKWSLILPFANYMARYKPNKKKVNSTIDGQGELLQHNTINAVGKHSIYSKLCKTIYVGYKCNWNNKKMCCIYSSN